MIRRFTPIVFLLIIIPTFIFAIPPKPEEGYRWVLNYDYSDEFNGTSLDASKWRDYFPGWSGRVPAKFKPNTISVKDGTMQIKNGVLSPAEGSYTIAGGAVQSLKNEAPFGYYECSFKASQIMMSTTFWLSNGKVPLDATPHATDRYSQELDISETIGGQNGTFSTHMHSNTHYRHDHDGDWHTPEHFHSKGANKALDSKVYEDFHTYAAWWIDANSVKFYADDEYFSTVEFSKAIDDTDPFDRTMEVNMVTETYTWATPYPTEAELNNDNINTSYYNWIRAYKLLKIDSIDPDLPDSVNMIFDDKATFENEDKATSYSSSYSFPMTFSVNVKRTLLLQLLNESGDIIGETEHTVLEGYGSKAYNVLLDSVPQAGINYRIVAHILPFDGTIDDALSTSYYWLIGEGVVSTKNIKVPIVEIYPNPAQDQLWIKNSNQEIPYSIISVQGHVLLEGILENNPISIYQLPTGVYFLKLENGSVTKFIKE